MGTMMVVLALAALAGSEIVFSRIERSRSVSDARGDDARVEPEDLGLEDEVDQEPVPQRAEDYSDLTPAEIRQRAKARLGPRAW